LHNIANSYCNGYGNWCCLCTKSKDIIRTCLHTANDTISSINSNYNTNGNTNDNTSNQCNTIQSKKEQLSWLLSTTCCADNTNTNTATNDNDNNKYDYDYDFDHNFYCFNKSLDLSDITKDYINDYNYNISLYSSSPLLLSSLSSLYNDNIIINSFIASFLTVAIITYMLIIKL